MWEFSACFYNKIYALNFKKSIENDIKATNGIITTISTRGFFKVLIAVPVNVKQKYFAIIKEKIAENILLFYKKDYILSKLNFSFDFGTNMNIFIKALICFDSEIDKEIILGKFLGIENSVIVDSFISFRLAFLKKKWKELVDLANDNSMYLYSEDTFVELIKFLISNLESRIETVNVFSKGDFYLICDRNGNVINDFLCDLDGRYDDEKLITNLIALNPEKIFVHCNLCVKDRLIKNLYEYFSNRVEICK